MEHNLQILIDVLFVNELNNYLKLKNIRNNESKLKKHKRKLLFFGVLLTMIRYEGLFILFTAVIILLIHKEMKFSCKQIILQLH